MRSLAKAVIFCLLLTPPILTAAFGAQAQDAISLGRTASQHSLGVGVGRLAHRTVNADSPIASMDRLVVSLNRRGAGTYRLAL